MSTLKALVVDDSLITVKKLTTMLEKLEIDVVATARTGKEALERYRDSSPDFVTMDITMPDMDGIEGTKQIVGEFPEARIIMITSHGQERMVLEALDAGAKGYVLKPIGQEKLDEMIKRVMTR